MRTGRIEANLNILNDDFKLTYIPELIERKTGGEEKGVLPEADMDFYRKEYEKLVAELERAESESRLPESGTGKQRLNDLLIRLRLGEQ